MELYYNKYQIEDLPDEVWVDVYGYYGLYSVSNLGRIKSEQREIHIRNGCFRIKKPLIMKQNIRAPHKQHQKHASVMFAVDRVHIRIEVSYIVGISFLRCLDKNEIYVHLDKNTLNNKLTNIGIMKKCDAISSSYILNKKPKGNISNIKNRKINTYVRLSDSKEFDYNSIKMEYKFLKDPVSNIRNGIKLKRKRMDSFWIIKSNKITDL
jgi:hypothetical protein